MPEEVRHNGGLNRDQRGRQVMHACMQQPCERAELHAEPDNASRTEADESLDHRGTGSSRYSA
jgi:hypothetical protein